ncbi:MAG: hypothetical protein JRH20_20815 [Deltaproteobacteria bacterium]|nr:hypothetical protein [Deltaproteobacteria bacterium]
MEQLTIRGFDPELQRRIRRLAKSKGISLNRAVLELLRKGAGLDDTQDDTGLIGSSLDTFIGTWSDEEADEFEESIAEFSTIDEEVWR